MILLTARSALNERLDGLNLGADDYLTKPFYIEELAARLHALLRRSIPRRAVEGVGLGLSLAREIFRAHGGDLGLDVSEEPLTAFLAWLPTSC